MSSWKPLLSELPSKAPSTSRPSPSSQAAERGCGLHTQSKPPGSGDQLGTPARGGLPGLTMNGPAPTASRYAASGSMLALGSTRERERMPGPAAHAEGRARSRVAVHDGAVELEHRDEPEGRRDGRREVVEEAAVDGDHRAAAPCHALHRLVARRRVARLQCRDAREARIDLDDVHPRHAVRQAGRPPAPDETRRELPRAPARLVARRRRGRRDQRVTWRRCSSRERHRSSREARRPRCCRPEARGRQPPSFEKTSRAAMRQAHESPGAKCRSCRSTTERMVAPKTWLGDTPASTINAS